MKFLLDNNAVIGLLRGDPRLTSRLKRQAPSDVGVSSIVIHELSYGAYKGFRVSENLARIDALQFEIVEFDREDARRAGQARAFLAKAGTPIGPYDVLIAGQALARDLALVTRNTREFDRLPGLALEDWELD
jgi:tRNA(fMet)-specific endonuclease VapC